MNPKTESEQFDAGVRKILSVSRKELQKTRGHEKTRGQTGRFLK